jgi:hypothetical protein
MAEQIILIVEVRDASVGEPAGGDFGVDERRAITAIEELLHGAVATRAEQLHRRAAPDALRQVEAGRARLAALGRDQDDAVGGA